MSFELKENPKRKKSRRLLQGRSDYGEEGKGEITAQPNSITEFTSTVKVENIGDMTPVQDFEAMISRRDSPDWVSKAIKDMSQKIFNLIEDSCEGDTFPKALECLVALRKGCILEQEPNQFNNFLRQLCDFSCKHDLNLCEYLASKGLTLISKAEAVDSEVTDDEARSFLVKAEPKVE